MKINHHRQTVRQQHLQQVSGDVQPLLFFVLSLLYDFGHHPTQNFTVMIPLSLFPLTALLLLLVFPTWADEDLPTALDFCIAEWRFLDDICTCIAADETSSVMATCNNPCVYCPAKCVLETCYEVSYQFFRPSREPGQWLWRCLHQLRHPI